MAIQVALHLGASELFGLARNDTKHSLIADLGATPISFGDVKGLARAADVDVVLDYVWGKPAAQTMVDLVTARGTEADGSTGWRSAQWEDPSHRFRPPRCAPRV